MSATLTININDRATDAVRELQRELSPKQLAATFGPRARELTRDHLAKLPDNKRGWPSTGFWESAARATRWEPTETGIKIIVDKQGVRQRWKGGPISPREKEALTIPVSPLAYGKTAADFPGSFILPTIKGAYIAMYGNEGPPQARGPGYGKRRALQRRRATLIILFKLFTGTIQQAANPDVMPTTAEYRNVVFTAARERLAGIKARKGITT